MFGVELPLRLPWPIPASSPSPTCFCCCGETVPPRASPGACGHPRFGRRNSRGSGYSVLAVDKLKSLIKLIRGHSPLVRLFPISGGGENTATTMSMASRPAVLAMWTTRRNVTAATVLLSVQLQPLSVCCRRGFIPDGGWNGSEGSKVGLLLCAPLADKRGEVVGEPCCSTVPAAAGLLQCIRRASMLQSQQRRVV